MRSTVRQLVPTWGMNRRYKFGTVPQSPIPFLKPGYVKTKRQHMLKRKGFPCFFIDPSANRPRDTYEVLLNSESVVHYRNVTGAQVPPSVPVSSENVISAPVEGGGRGVGSKSRWSGGRGCGFERIGAFHPRGKGALWCPTESVTESLVAPTPAAVPCGGTALAGGRGTATAT